MPDYNPFNREERTEERSKEQQRLHDLELADVLFVMADAAGRRFMHRLLSRAGVFRSSFDEDPYKTAFNEGQRNIGLAFTAQIMEIAAPQYAQMLEENRYVS